ncbi:MAG: peroxiredoxin family protein [Actinobacteria bacterium]|nr:peroxiredoxin family protein [Actinomycetota bacterium]MBU1944396.1 peroxiredoxin family protein [Actinomycetota bacterium]MBU2688264.1 peroxiredoxin family protein [Actinomycetota bacterium]
MGHVRRHTEDFDKRGAKVVGILTQDPGHVKEYLKEHSYPFPLLVDYDRSVARAYGVHVKLNLESVNIARNCVFVIDGEGIIRWMYIGYHQADWPDDSEVFAALDSITAPATVS